MRESLPKSESTIPDCNLRIGIKSSTLQVQQHFLPRLLAFAVAVLHSKQLLLSILGGTHDDKNALTVLFQSDVEVNAIDPDVNVSLV